jgi:hypothetical protein
LTVIADEPLPHKLEEGVLNPMNETEAIQAKPEEKKSDRGRKSILIDEALKANLPTKEIVEKVKAEFPDFADKNIRNLISVRRSKLKKAAK